MKTGVRRLTARFLVLSLFLGLATVAQACGGAAPAPPSVPTPPVASAAAPATPSADGSIDLPGGGRGLLALPTAGAGKHPAIVVIHEWWGLDDWVKGDAARFAQRGYVALAVDLYRGKVAHDPDEAHELMRGMPEDRAMSDLKAGFDYLAARPDVDPAHIGAIGWCMGGGYSLAFAVAEPRLRAVVVNYGRLVTAPDKLDAIHAALLGNFAGADRGIAPDDVRTFTAALKDKHKDVDVKIYDGRGHAFMNPGNKSGYDEGAATDAWARIDAFFARTLKGG